MDTPSQSCEAVIARVRQVVGAQPPGPLAADTARHICSCPRCRAELDRFAGAAATAAPKPVVCASCRADLGVFLAREQVEPDEAVAAYPQVWQHLWSCPDCLDDYLSSRAWLEQVEEEQAGQVGPLRLPVPGPLDQALSAIRRIVIERAALRLALPAPQLALAPVRGLGGDGFVLFEDGDSPSHAHFTVMVRDSGDGTWQMEVTTRPPLVGLLRFSAGATRLTTPFLPDGSATIKAIPFALLADNAAPDLELIVLPVRAGPGL